MSGPPQLPPFGFGMSGSPFPPLPSSRFNTPAQTHSATFRTPSSSSAAPPPPPPLPHEARQQEAQWRQQNGYNTGIGAPSKPPRPSQGTSSHGVRAASYAPGQLIAPTVVHPHESGRRASGFVQHPRASSPMLSPGHEIQRPASASAMPGSFRSASVGQTVASHQDPDQSYNAAPPHHGEAHRALSPAPMPARQPSQTRRPQAHGPASSSGNQRNVSNGGGPPPLALPLSDMKGIGERREKALASGQEKMKLDWARMVVKYVERAHSDTMSLTDPVLIRYVDEAMAVINRRASATPPDLLALYLRGDLRASGNFPSYHRKDPKNAFNDFELSGRMGYAPSWFRIGRDYETLGDVARAQDAYARGKGHRDVGCIYRLGMANLIGQIGINQDYATAMALLKDAADLSNEDTPQPSYIFGMLFAGEFAHLNIPPYLLSPVPDPSRPDAPTTAERTALFYIERAAYLNFAPAHYKLGWAYEYAQLDCAFDPLLSVQYYSLASKGGEVEADMAVSKWFLCGAEGCFDKNESLAYTFAEKAARKGLPSAEFALAYYHEVGVGCQQSLSVAKKWYKKAAAHGNTDATQRLEELSSSSGPRALSRKEHEAHLDTKLQRKHTAAQMKSTREGRGQRPGDRSPNPAASISTGFEHLNLKDDHDDEPYAAPQQTMRMVGEAAGSDWHGIPSTPPLSSGPAKFVVTPPSQAGRPTTPTPPRHGAAPGQLFVSSPHHTPHGNQEPSTSEPGYGYGSGFRQGSASSSAASQTPSGYRMPAGYTLQESYAPSVAPHFSKNGFQATPQSGPSTPGTHVSSAMLSQSPGRQVHRPGPGSSTQSSEVSGASDPSRRRSSEARKYNTFAEMGFQSSSAGKDKDCIVM